MADTSTQTDLQAQWARNKRLTKRDLSWEDTVNWQRREQALADVFTFLQTYFPETFDQPWTENRREMVHAIFEALETRTAQAIAAPRGEGKSTITQCVLAYCICKGLIRFAVLVAATQTHAAELLENLKAHFERNELMLEDFPEICVPARDVATAPQRAGAQTVRGRLTNIEWSSESVIFPDVPGSPASGIIVKSRGITSSLRGLNVYGVRPDLVVIDDPDDEESAESDAKTIKRVKKINRSIRGLGTSRGLGRVMLCTLINRVCVAAQYTDREINPAWHGRRYKAIEEMPERIDLWDDYIDFWREDNENGDKRARRAHAFYLENRSEMDRGAVVSNPHRFDPSLLGDGTQIEASALQACYNIIAESGWDDFATEYQNDPPSKEQDDENKLTEFKVRGTHPDYVGRCNGMDRGLVPDDTVALTAAVDVQKRTLYFEVVAWRADGRRHVVDYGAFGDTSIADRAGPSASVQANLRELFEHWTENPYCDSSEVVPFNCVLVDSGYETEAVCECVTLFGKPWRASMGDPKYRHPQSTTKDKRPSRNGDRWYDSRQPHGLVVNMDVDDWKHKSHNSWTVQPQGDPVGCVTLFGENPKDHTEFGQQVCAEEWVEEFTEGKGVKRGWHQMRRDNHYLDCDAYNMVAGSICGVFAKQRTQTRPVQSNNLPRRGDGQSFFITNR